MSAPRLVITGATGWVGRTALHELQRLLTPEEFQERVLAFASTPRQIPSTAYPKPEEISLSVQALESMPDLLKGCRNVALLHAAFLTKDRLDQVGIDAFIERNQTITATVCAAIADLPCVRVVAISSGAASQVDPQGDLEQQISTNPYGALKRREELRLAQVAPTQVLRLYALTGRFIRDPHAFAIGDFLLQAQRGQPIQLQSTAEVLRGYGHAGDITRTAWKWLAGEESPGPAIATVSQEISLLQLAETISEVYHLPPVAHKIDRSLPRSIYSAPRKPYEDVMQKHGEVPLSLEEQILDTALGVNRACERNG
jgi:nucleoside-diphosphate-sugar epimerase